MVKDLTSHREFGIIDSPDSMVGRGLGPMAAPPPFDEPPEGEGRPDLGRYFSAVLRFKWLILALTIAGTALGVVAAQVVQPKYQARTTLWIETASPQEDLTGPIRPDELLRSSSWIELLQSGLVLDSVVLEQRLFIRPKRATDSVYLSSLRVADAFAPGEYRLQVDPANDRYFLSTRSGAIVERGAVGDSVGRSLGMLWAPHLEGLQEGLEVSFALQSPRAVSIALAGQLRPQLDRNDNFLQISLDGTDPEGVARILNAITERYVAVAADLKRSRLDELVAILNEQLEYSQQRLSNAERALEDFRIRTVTLPTDRSTPVAPGLQSTRDPIFANFFQMRVELEGIRQDQEVIDRAIETGRSGGSYEALATVDAVRASVDLQQALKELAEKQASLRALRYRYTDEHPPVRELMAEITTLETQTLPTLARAVLGELELREQQLEQRLNSYSSELEQIPPRAIEEARLTRSVESADNLYANLLRRYEEARLAAASSIPDVRVLDRAIVPREPVRDQKPLLIALAFAGSLGLGILGAIVRDRFDKRLRYPHQVTKELGLPILVGIPNLKNRRAFFGGDNTMQAQEAFRSLRLGVAHAFGSAGTLITTVTSPGPGDGKSFVSANLARAFADIGRRTLLVDGDTRRGRLHEIFDVERKPGLIDLVRNGGAPQSTIRLTDHENLFLLTCGSRVPKGPELISSRQMRELIMQVRGEFDVVIVDSPPLSAGVDPFVLATLCGSVLMVLRTGETDRSLADAKLEFLDRLPVRMLGAVLNGVPPTGEYRYYSYTLGYESRGEDDAGDLSAVLVES